MHHVQKTRGAVAVQSRCTPVADGVEAYLQEIAGVELANLSTKRSERAKKSVHRVHRDCTVHRGATSACPAAAPRVDPPLRSRGVPTVHGAGVQNGEAGGLQTLNLKFLAGTGLEGPGMAGVAESAKRRMLAVNEKGYRIGEDRHGAKLTNHEVDLLLQLADEGMSERQLAEKFEISRRTVRDYKAGRRRCQTPAGYRWALKSGTEG